jgi:curved DNA-binding protein CbpA
MFKDYYAILDISESASLELIREAFKRQAIKWHPDKNIGFDTTEMMQDINEAYLILKDAEARLKYDKEYQSFKTYKTEYQRASKDFASTEPNKNYYEDYKVKDPKLKNWMQNASVQAVDLAQQTIKDFSGMIKEGCLASSEIITKTVVSILIATLIWFILFSSFKSCH